MFIREKEGPKEGATYFLTTEAKNNTGIFHPYFSALCLFTEALEKFKRGTFDSCI